MRTDFYKSEKENCVLLFHFLIIIVTTLVATNFKPQHQSQ